jgi:hypothetical protein
VHPRLGFIIAEPGLENRDRMGPEKGCTRIAHAISLVHSRALSSRRAVFDSAPGAKVRRTIPSHKGDAGVMTPPEYFASRQNRLVSDGTFSRP